MGYNLDKYQKNAVQTKDRNALIVAAPGSGKTTVIINRVNYLVKEKNILNKNIIVITFTKAAAVNMKMRYFKAFNTTSAPFFGTFHGLFYKILSACGKQIDIIDGGIVRKIVNNVLLKHFDDVSEEKIKEAVNNISLFKTARIPLNEYRPSFSKNIFEEILNAYEKYKEENRKYDFDDLCIEVLGILKNDERMLNGYRRLFKYILVDEFQDCDEMQLEFLKLMNKDSTNSLFAVGDEDQCIYSFRGSKPEYMVSFGEIFEDGKKHYLSLNYRSRHNIVESSKQVIGFNINRNKKCIEAFKRDEGVIKWFNSYNEKIQCENIVNIIEENKKKGISYESNVVLYRTNIESMAVIDVLSKKHIPFNILDREYNFFEHFICRDIISYLKLSINNYDKESFVSIINKPFRYIGKSNIGYIKNFKVYKTPFEILIDKDDVPPFQKKKIDDFRKDINYLNKTSLSGAIAYIIMDLGYIDYLREYAQKFGYNLEDLEDIIEEFKLTAEGFKTISEFLRHIEEIKKNIEESKKKEQGEGVILSTIHGVKGMEFKNVYIMNCIEDTIPHSSNENMEEERRLFYVGITRAIDELYLFTPRSRRGAFRDVSRFIVEGKFNLLPPDTYGYEKGSAVKHKIYENGVIEQLEGDKVKIKFKDGIVRSFSLKVLVDNELIERKNI